jgi:polysaccharide deacetylase family protein (PEP-CTERM system associated)
VSATSPVNALTVDVEEYFQVSAFEDAVGRDRWPELESRVRVGMERLLALCASRSVKATFFVLGWIAERAPELIREIQSGGHEIASHGYEHRLVTSLDADAFRADLARAAAAIEAACGARVQGFRAPSFSFSPTTPWAHEVLQEEGYHYSSSVFPVRHDRYGMPDYPRHPVRVAPTNGDDAGIWEFPMTTWRVLGKNLPAGGGGWLRALPLFVTKRAIRQRNAEGWPAVVYVHPWELDPEQPRMQAASRASRFRHYLNLDKTEERLARLLDLFPFNTMRAVLARLESSPSA